MNLNWRNLSLMIIVVFLMSLILFTLNDGGVQMKEGKYKKVLLIGIDGMDPKITDKLMEEGLLPNFARMKETGDFKTLDTSLPPHSPVAWTSIATGTNPGKHNVFDFIKRNPETYLPELSLSKSVSGIAGTDYTSVVKSDPFWRITTKADLPTTVIRWPVTFPPERIEGNMLSGLGVPDVRGFLSGYTFYTSGKIDDTLDGSEKTVQVSYGDSINTFVSGPRKREGNEVVSVKVPMEITLDKDKKIVTLSLQGTEYAIEVNNWSDWVRVKFNIGFMKDVYGICKVYLVSVEPEFKMYLTTMQIDPLNPVFAISAPNDYSADLAKDIGLYYTLGMPEETDALVDNKITDEVFLQQCAQIEAERDKMFWKEFEKFKNSDRGILAFVYDTSDRIQHTFWDEKLFIENDSELSLNENVVEYFVNKDRFLGEILSQLDNETALIIVSDHGFTSFERAVSINTWLVKNGFITLTKEISVKDEGALFRYVDWSKTKAYSVGFNSLYLNLEGREAKGIVKESEKNQVIDEIIEKLSDLSDNKTGKKPITKLYRSTEVYAGDCTKNSPDIMIGFSPGYRMSWQNAVGGLTPEVIFDNTKKWDGDHLVDPSHVPGIIFSNFKLNDNKPSQMDVAPTVLSLIGIQVPENMDGKSLA